MDEGIVRMQAQMFALVAEMNAILVGVEGMKAANTERESQGFALAYPESIFNDASKDLEGIATELNRYNSKKVRMDCCFKENQAKNWHSPRQF